MRQASRFVEPAVDSTVSESEKPSDSRAAACEKSTASACVLHYGIRVSRLLANGWI